jgi:hypothetical protein
LKYNRLTAQDQSLILFLDKRNPGWAETQTLPPTGVEITEVTETSFKISWQPVDYTAHPGYYVTACSSQPNGPYTPSAEVGDKSTTELTISALQPGTPYFCIVQTVTNAHPEDDQRYALTSLASAIVSTTTLGEAAPAPPIMQLPTTSRLSINISGKGHGTVDFSPLGNDCETHSCVYATGCCCAVNSTSSSRLDF